MKRMSKKVSLFIIFSIVIGLLGGCQLAKMGKKMEQEKAK